MRRSILASVVLLGWLTCCLQCTTTTSKTATVNAEHQKMLAEYLELPPAQIQVRADSKVTHVTISGESDPIRRAGIDDSLQTLNENNPSMNPFQWRFQ